MNKLLLFSVLLSSIAFELSGNSQVSLYSAGRNSTNLYEYDTTGGPGSFTLLSTIAMSTDFAGGIEDCYGLSLDPSTGDMYILYEDASGGGSNSRRLGIVDLTTGAITDVGNAGNLTDIAFMGPQLFGTSGMPTSHQFVRVNKTDASTIDLFAHPTSGYGHSIWWNPYTDRLYKTTQQTGQFSEIDTTTMTETVFPSSGHPGWSSSAVAINDSISISTSGSTGSPTIYVINTNTWTFTTAGNMQGGHAKAFGDYPLYIVIDGPTILCDNDNNTVLTASESGTTQWFLDGTPISGATATTHIPLETGLYTVEVDGKTTNPVMITVHPAPTASFDATPNPVDLGITPSGTVDFTNTSTEGNEYHWDLDTDIETTLENPSYSFNTVGDYEVVFTVTIDSTGCSDTATTTITVINSTGINELSADFSIYPIPTQDVVFVQMTNASTTYSIELRDIQGRLVKVDQVTPSNSNVSVDLTEMESGVYFLNVFNQEEQGSFKIIKK